jgi:hypothetical protein
MTGTTECLLVLLAAALWSWASVAAWRAYIRRKYLRQLDESWARACERRRARVALGER